MAWQVEILEPAEAFLLGLSEDDYAMFDAAIKLLEEHGPNLGEPIVKTIKNSAYKNLKELRRQANGRIYRILFAFDKNRHAVLLVGGDKAEIGFDDFYTVNIPVAEKLLSEHQKIILLAHEAAKKAAPKKSDGKGNLRAKKK